MEFKNRLVYLRKELHLTQEELSEKLGISRTALSAWEVGRNEPSYSDTIRLANFFNVSTDYLLGKSDIRKPLTYNLTNEEINFIKNIKKLDETNKMIIENTIEALFDKQEKNKK